MLVRVQATAAQAVMGSIALALVVRKPMATHLVQEEMGQEVIRAVAVVVIGAVGARVKLNSTDPELADATYIEPITPEMVAKIIAKEKTDAAPAIEAIEKDTQIPYIPAMMVAIASRPQSSASRIRGHTRENTTRTKPFDTAAI